MKRFLKYALCAIVTMISLVGCGSEPKDNGYINGDVYVDETYWSEDKINTITDVSIIQEEADDELEEEVFSELTEKQVRQVEKLKKLILKYFIKEYNVDFSEKLRNQKVTIFSTSIIGNSMVMGYVDIKDSNTLHLNVVLNGEYKEIFETTYVHETLHQLGIQDKTCDMTYVVEGIADAYTDLILTEGNIEAKLTDLYFEPRQLGYQMIKADRELLNVLLSGKSLKERINQLLDSYEQEPMQHKDLAGYLNTLLEVVIAINSGMGYSEYMPYFYVFDAQSIVQKYCQAQGCDKETIEYVRKHYLIEDFENLKIVDMGDGGYSLVCN